MRLICLLFCFCLSACVPAAQISRAAPTATLFLEQPGVTVILQNSPPAPTATPTPVPPHASKQILPAPVTSFAVDPQDGRIAFALLATNELYRTRDAGATWQKLSFPARTFDDEGKGRNPNSVFLIPQNDIRIIAAPHRIFFVRADWTLYRSDDEAQSWRALQTQVTAWDVEPTRGRVLYVWRDNDARRADVGLYRSQDGGTTWEQTYTGYFPPFQKDETVMPNHQGMTALALDPQVSGVLYAGTDFGIYRSTNRGKIWHAFNEGLPPTQFMYRWAPLLIANQNALFVLTDTMPDKNYARDVIAKLPRTGLPGQAEWRESGFGALSTLLHLAQDPIQTIAVDPRNPARIYLGTTRGLLVSSDGGETWQPRDELQVGAVYRIGVTTSDKPFM